MAALHRGRKAPKVKNGRGVAHLLLLVTTSIVGILSGNQCSSFNLPRHYIVQNSKKDGASSKSFGSLYSSSFHNNLVKNEEDDKNESNIGPLDALQLERSGRLLISALAPEAAIVVPLSVAGVASIPRLGSSTTNETIVCAVLSRASTRSVSTQPQFQDISSEALLLPVPNCDSLHRLLPQVKSSNFSRLQLLLWNGEIINRDNGLFDNLPYTEWTAFGPRDAAGQPVAPSYHWGKRQFYNRLMGQDWYKYSYSDRTGSKRDENDSRKDPPSRDSSRDIDNNPVLQIRICEIQLREVQMNIAECDSEIAIWKRALLQDDVGKAEVQEKLEQWQSQRAMALEEAERIQAKMDRLNSHESYARPLDGMTTGAHDNNDKNNSQDTMSFENPFKMFQCLVREMLKAEIVAVFLEDTSWSQQSSSSSSIVLGGGIVLQRETIKKDVSILGETVQVINEKETFGSDSVKPGDIFVVDCFADEAVKLSIACDVALWSEASLLDAGSMKFVQYAESSLSTMVRSWKPLDQSTVMSVQGRPVDYNGTIAPVLLNFDLLSRWEQAIGGPTSKQVCPSDNTIQSLSEYDELSSDDKIRLLLSLGDDSIKIPRPRAIRRQPQMLNDLLLPRVDEVVRTQWRLREAGDDAENIPKSQRFLAKEMAQKARKAGLDDVADWWQNEADLLSSIRADITQDEGTYNRFLDKDDWYERDRREAAERARQQFGQLGIE